MTIWLLKGGWVIFFCTIFFPHPKHTQDIFFVKVQYFFEEHGLAWILFWPFALCRLFFSITRTPLPLMSWMVWLDGFCSGDYQGFYWHWKEQFPTASYFLSCLHFCNPSHVLIFYVSIKAEAHKMAFLLIFWLMCWVFDWHANCFQDW